MAELEIKGVDLTISKKRIIKDVSFKVPDRELFVLCGPSGAGKTTILKLITGEWTPESGDILLDGRSLLGTPMRKRGVILVSQGNDLFPHMTVRKNAAFGLGARHIKGKEADEIIGRFAEMCGIAQLLDRYPAELSGGQQKLAAILRALVLQPSVLLLDEPFTGLDGELSRRMRDFILDLQKENGITIVMITHSKEDAFYMGQHIGFLFDGKMELVKEVSELFEKTGNTAVDSFLGETIRTENGGFVFADKVLRKI
ncbi:MAG: ABC transporter ATP-binding protein [Lachnospiraceae bacterium]|nr:ABC transporter ATP-binding protein [Lachnospiraceae bacterium]